LSSDSKRPATAKDRSEQPRTAVEDIGMDEALDTAVVDQDLQQLRASLQKAEQQNAEQHEAMLRMQAEMENLRKRLIRDLERSRRRALEDFMNDLLPVRDSLYRGLEVATDEAATVESLREGKALILKMLAKAMEDHGLEEIDPAGETFDPELHEAISMIPSSDHPRDTVIEVVQRGYQLNERLIRPARVVVSAGAPG
jgi:molecular chaperone GrpE